MTFHDGSTFGPEDVVYTINHVSNPDSGVLSSRIVSWMKSAEALGGNKVRIHLNGPFPAAFAYLSNAVFMVPEGHYDDAPMTADGKKDYGTVAPVGTGPPTGSWSPSPASTCSGPRTRAISKAARRASPPSPTSGSAPSRR